METLALQLWENPPGLSHSPKPGTDSERLSLVKSIQWSKPRCGDPENSGSPSVMGAARPKGCAAGSPAGGQAACQGLAPPGDGTALQLAGAKTSGHRWTVANPNSISNSQAGFLASQAPCPGAAMYWDASQGLSRRGQFAWALPQGSEKRGIFVRLIANQADCFAVCLFLAQKKYKNLQFTRSFKMLALDSSGWKSNFEKQSSFATGTRAFQPAPVNTMNNRPLTFNLQLKSKTEEHKVHLLTRSQNYWQLQKHDVCNHFTYSLKRIKQWLHLKRFVNIMNIIIVGHKRLGLVPVLK